MNTGIELPPPPPPLPSTELADAEFPRSADERPARTCPNCGAPAHGPFCYACGQSEKGMIRHLSEVMVDLADIVFNVDSRIFRSLGDLYFRPGYLTTEYLAGRRARYVTPFRLFFFLSIIAFFAIQASIDANDIQIGNNDSIATATTAEAVKQQVDRAVEGLETEKAATGVNDKTIRKLDDRIASVRERGAERIKEIEAHAAAVAAGKEPPDEKKEPTVTMFEVDGKPWDFKSNPVHVDWLSDGLNARLNNTVEHMRENVLNFKKDPSRLVAGWFSVLPQTLFVVMPLFAVLLKFFYLFKRRLYMEHLLVALHSHAFIFMSVLVILLIQFLRGLSTDIGWLEALLGWLLAAAWTWLFVYLLLMQKRVYRQGWFMTILKYCVIGWCYSIFLTLALVAAGLISLALT
ncbi:MAG: DUF3667 domain-containing protein [Dokdonella sp.]|nr:DUF3667 domain-containing protein [Dokdonella sp.]MCB1571108.1 DUF3667 domain-containing protein [Xanthomonadales bacterium]MCB1572710.1 DUF3667 domain-containing protein [Xanthomonadales bacterium]MCB1575819.1 DUF3667 domain-containing protein [Xanthomonadales bacterium]